MSFIVRLIRFVIVEIVQAVFTRKHTRRIGVK